MRSPPLPPLAALPRPRWPLLRCPRFGEAPVNHQRFAVGPQHDVVGFEIAVEDAAAVGVGDGVAHVHEARQQPPQFQAARPRVLLARVPLVEVLEGVLETVALDEAMA